VPIFTIGKAGVAAHHFLADLTLPYGHVLYDYNKDS
jgi:acetoacetate decarboxylase